MGGGPPTAKEGGPGPLANAFAGGVAGCIARFLVGPLDVIKIRFQVQLEPIKGIGGPGPAPVLGHGSAAAASKYTGFRQAFVTILREEGIQGLWRGTVPGILLTVPYTAVQFVALQQLRDAAARHGFTANPSLAPLVSLGSGALAGAAGTIASYPFDLLRTTMAAQGEPKVYRTLWDAAKGIVSQRGITGLYSGLGVTVLEIMPYAALQFGMYDTLQAAWKHMKAQRDVQRRAQHPGAPEPEWHDAQVANFVCGLLAGLFAKLATHPLDVAKKRYQVAGLQRSLRYGARVQPTFALQSLGASLANIYRTEGIAGLWKGSFPSIVKAAPSAAITFTVYEAVLTWLLAASHARKAEELASHPVNTLEGGKRAAAKSPAPGRKDA